MPPNDKPPPSQRGNDKPPPSKRDSSPELLEVERAMSVLQGRHPGAESARREDEQNKASRAAENAAAHKLAQRYALVRRLKLGAIGLVVLGALFVIAKSVRKENTRTESLRQAGQPFTDKGFTVLETSSRGDPTKIEVDVDAGCFVAATAKPGRIKLAYTGGFVEGDSSVLTCLCEPGRVTVTSDRNAEGLVLLRNTAASIGGSRAFYFLPFKVGSLGESDQACAESSLDGWIEAKHWLTLTPEEKWLVDPDRKPLRDAGFKVAGSMKPELPFGVIEVPANTCALLVDESGTARTSVRLKGGGLAIGPATGTIAWCTSNATTAVAQREGKSALTILFAPAAQVGGLWGLREAAEKSKLQIAAMSVPASDRNWIAKQLLTASAIPESLVSLGTEDTDKEARIVSLSVEKPGTLVPDAAEGVFSFCDPPMNDSSASLCVFSGAQRWKIEGVDSVAGIARAKTPFWLFGLEKISEPVALKRQTQIITLARALHREGFEPTTIEAVTETDKGTEVLGRANEDAIVALMLSPTEPWVIPLAETSETSWSLDAGAPRVVKLKTLERITLVPPLKTKLPPKDKRRRVIFRHHS